MGKNPNSKIIDISLPIKEDMVNYPGNFPVSIKEDENSVLKLHKIILGSHTGTHIDAPKHVFEDRLGVDKVNLESLIGKCRVLDMTHIDESIKVKDLIKAKIKKGERILVKTENSLRGYKKFHDDYIHLSGDAAEFLANRKIYLFGIDYLSIKKRGDSDNRPHIALLKNKIIILEGIDLSKVNPGNYFLIVLPLKIRGLDGSPARAILLKDVNIKW